MPTYEYRCPNGHQFDQFARRFSDAQPTAPCPVCGQIAQRVISGGAALLFKGSGFYITDYGKDGKKDQQARKDAAAPPSASSSDKANPPAPSGAGGDAPKATPPAPQAPPASDSSRSGSGE